MIFFSATPIFFKISSFILKIHITGRESFPRSGDINFEVTYKWNVTAPTLRLHAYSMRYRSISMALQFGTLCFDSYDIFSVSASSISSVLCFRCFSIFSLKKKKRFLILREQLFSIS